MPKVKINNTQGLVQATGGGVAFFGATESLTASGAGTQIAETTSLALCDSAADAHIIKLPAIGNLDTGHTVVIANIANLKEFHLSTAAASTFMNGVQGAGSTAAEIENVKENSVITCIYSGAANPGWIVLTGDQATLPS